jgi:septal ring factor EnvC (AmiA/AmiB activator)
MQAKAGYPVKQKAVRIHAKSSSLAFLIGGTAIAQTRDPRVDELTKETAQLKRRIADQDGRIAELEKVVKALQAAAASVPTRIPSETPSVAWGF